ncbi:hypothetical protein DPMN_141391, partial [Dreissena polymorpha]
MTDIRNVRGRPTTKADRPGRDDNQCLSTRPSQQTQEPTHHSHSGVSSSSNSSSKITVGSSRSSIVFVHP